MGGAVILPSSLVTPAIPSDSLQRAVEEVFARPEYAWVQGERPLHWLRDLWLGFVEWLQRFSAQHPGGARVLFWGALLLLVVLLIHLGLTVWRIYRATVERPGGAAPGVAPVVLDAARQLARAEELAQAGRYTEALAHRFMALVLELDRAQVLAFHPAKTPAEYVHEARLEAPGRDSLAGLVRRLYTHVFGAEPCDQEAYRDFGAAAGAVLQHVVPR